MTKAADIDERTMVSMLSRMSLRPGDSGTYACHDASDLRNFDDVEVMVRPADRGQGTRPVTSFNEGFKVLLSHDIIYIYIYIYMYMYMYMYSIV